MGVQSNQQGAQAFMNFLTALDDAERLAARIVELEAEIEKLKANTPNPDAASAPSAT